MRRHVVVGVDGSVPSLAALGVAAAEARWRGADLVVAFVYDPPRLEEQEVRDEVRSVVATPGAGHVTPPLDTEPQRRVDAARHHMQRRAEARLGRVLDTSGENLSDLHVERVAIAGADPSDALVGVAARAELLVLGSRGRRGFASLVLGSVTHQVVHHARCPVLVVPPRTT